MREARVEVLRGGLREVVQQVVGELAPAQLADVAVHVGAVGGRARTLQFCRDPPGRYFAEMQVRRQPRGARAVGTVAVRAVAVERAIDEDLQCLARAGLAGRPDLPEAGIPAQCRCQAPGIERFARQRVFERGQRAGRIPRRRCAPLRKRRPPERREHLVRPTLLRGEVPGFEQQAAIETFHLQALLTKPLLQRGIARLGGGFVLAVPEHRQCTGLLHQRPQLLRARPLAQEQARPACPQIRIERRQRPVQPRKGSGTGAPFALFLRRMHVDGNGGESLVQGCAQGGIVVQAQIVAEPDKGVGHGRSLRTSLPITQPARRWMHRRCIRGGCAR